MGLRQSPGAPQTASQRLRSCSIGSSPVSASRTWISSRLSRSSAGAGLRRERVERRLLVEVDQADPAARRVGERDQRAEQPGAEALRLEGGVDRVQVGAQAADVGRVVPVEQPGEAELVAGHLDRRARRGRRRAARRRRPGSAGTPGPRRRGSRPSRSPVGRSPSVVSQRDRGGRYGEQRVQVGRLRAAAPGDDVPEAHQVRSAAARPGSARAARGAAPASGASR